MGVQSCAMAGTQQIRVARRVAGRGLMTATAASLGLAWLRPGLALADDVPIVAPGVVADAPPPEPEITSLELLVLSLVSGARSGAGLASLQWDPGMTAAARSHAQDMMKRGVVSHTGSDGSDPKQRMRRFGVEFRLGSENIWTYWGKVPDEGPPTMHAAMMAEPFRPGLWNHIGNILNAGYRRIGVGLVIAPSGVQYLSETFAD
jgi:uncharacterized protein YkwD